LKNYYERYLGIDKVVYMNSCSICVSENRDTPINKRYIYKVIISDYNNQRVVSISPQIFLGSISSICEDIKDKTLNEILFSKPLLQTELRVSKMYRMALGNINVNNYSKQKIACEYLSDYKKYVIRDGDKIVSYCKVSNIDFAFGNLVIWTDEKYRRKGFAREVLLATILKCKLDGIEPLYFVNSRNAASLELAKTVGFIIAQTEITACEEVQ